MWKFSTHRPTLAHRHTHTHFTAACKNRTHILRRVRFIRQFTHTVPWKIWSVRLHARQGSFVCVGAFTWCRHARTCQRKWSGGLTKQKLHRCIQSGRHEPAKIVCAFTQVFACTRATYGSNTSTISNVTWWLVRGLNHRLVSWKWFRRHFAASILWNRIGFSDRNERFSPLPLGIPAISPGSL